MADIIYLTLNGNKQGLISAGCSSYDSIGNRYQNNHKNISHAPFVFEKADDKSSALLLSSITNNEILECDFKYYRIDKNGGLLHYKTIKLTKSSIIRIKNTHPNSLLKNEYYPTETISLRYESITVNHIVASTSGYSISNNI